MKIITFCGAILGFFGVALGAFGAHALRDQLAASNMTQTWQTAVQYNLIHAIGCVALAYNARFLDIWLRRAGLAWITGVILFSGSLYGIALGGPRFLGPITPLGGLCFLYGWACVAWGAWTSKTDSKP